MGAAAVDLARFDSDSEDAPVAAAGERQSTGAGPSSPGVGNLGGGGGVSKAARLRAKKAAARAAQKQRRKEELKRFPAKQEVNASTGREDDDIAYDSEDGSDDDGTCNAKTQSKPHHKNAVADKTHHGVLNVEGVFVGEKLILLDRKHGAVYSSTRRAFDGTHLKIGCDWDDETKSYDKLDRDEIETQLKPPPIKKKKNDASNPNEEEDQTENQTELQMEKPPTEVSHTFEVDVDDHCETSPEAHKNIVNFLAKTAEFLGKKPSELIIYDPYYCAGGTQRSFKALGFPNTINENKDFYKVVADGEVPAHDVLVTNPPYSEDHVERCLQFAARNLSEFGRPYFLLLPSYVINKPYYVDALLTGGAQGRAARENREDAKGGDAQGSDLDSSASDEESASEESEDESQSESEKEMKVHDGSKRHLDGKIKDIAVKRNKDGTVDKSASNSHKQTLPFYVAPFKRYYYWTPKALAAERKNRVTADGKKKKKGHVGRLGERTSPFPSFWYCGLGDELQTDALRWHRKLPKAMVEGYTVASHPNDLPVHVLDEWDPRRAKLLEQAQRDAENNSNQKNWKNGGKNGTNKKPPPRRFAGFSGANCGQNMDKKDKVKYAEFQNSKNDKPNWGNGKGSREREGSMFVRPRKKNKF